jgi:brefeldin A-inhibited guanine nucleotide-exchange protein
VVDLSLQIFVKLIASFKDHLKAEIEVFICNVFLRILESANSTFDHKRLVLEVFHAICQDPQALVEIFLNYDCNFDNVDLFRRIVLTLASVAKSADGSGDGIGGGLASGISGGSSSKRAYDERSKLQLKGLEALVATTHSLMHSSSSLERTKALTEGSSMQNSRHRNSAAVNNTDDDVDEHSEQVLSLASAATSAAASGASSGNIGDAHGKGQSLVESFESKKRIQEELTTGVLKFNMNPKKGLVFLEQRGQLESPLSAPNVAAFLHRHQDKLDKTAIGEFLGKEKDYWGGIGFKVLHEYIDMMEFDGMVFDEAIRHFLSGFRLPGEAQKIDRMMEKFAERYCLQNQGVFPNADTAFVLAFSIIMLNTDLHNPAIQDDRRMTKAGFRRQAEGIANGGDLDGDYLDGIYERIKINAISLKEDDELRSKDSKQNGKSSGSSAISSMGDMFSGYGHAGARRKQEAFTKEREDMVRESEIMFSQVKRRKRIEYVNMGDLTDEHIKPMFEVAWGPILGVYSFLLDRVDDSIIIGLCLNGLKDSVRIAAVFNIPLVRDTLINTLAKFTTLDTVREMMPKNIECIRVLISIAVTDGDYLAEAWFSVLECISQLARLHLLSEGLTDDSFFGGSDGLMNGDGGSLTDDGTEVDADGKNSIQNKRKSVAAAAYKLFYGPSKAEAARQVEESNAEAVMGQIDGDAIDRVFSNSTNLSSQAIKDFVTQLCLVSLKELQFGAVRLGSKAGGESSSSMSSFGNFRSKDIQSDMAQPRVFSLQKLVEVADYNMPIRGRIVWANIWRFLADHFTTVRVKPN